MISMHSQIREQHDIKPSFMPVLTGPLQRRCTCSGSPGLDGECEECRNKRLQRRSTNDVELVNAPPIVHETLRSPGQPLDSATRSFMELRFGHDFSKVRVHTDARAVESAQLVNALAYTVGRDVVFGAKPYTPTTTSGKMLLAHELTHVVQQSNGDNGSAATFCIDNPSSFAERQASQIANSLDLRDGSMPIYAQFHCSKSIQRACLPASVCNVPIAGSAEEFVASEEALEAPARSRRSRMSPTRARASGHAGHARQLERFLEAQTPGLLTNIHGIFVDQDISSNTGAYLLNCASFEPPITGATKPCVFVPGSLNQEALLFNTQPAATTIGGSPREDWRVSALQTLTHEVQHALFEARVFGATPGVSAGCPRSSVDSELDELNAIMSEFPIVYRAIPAAAAPGHQARIRLADWFDWKITNPDESIEGALTKMRCTCNCTDVNNYVRDTFNFTAGAWTTDEKSTFNAELKKPKWALNWPL